MASQAHSFPSTSSYSLLQEPIDSLVAICKRSLVARQLLLSVAVACTILASRRNHHFVSSTLLPLPRICIRMVVTRSTQSQANQTVSDSAAIMDRTIHQHNANGNPELSPVGILYTTIITIYTAFIISGLCLIWYHRGKTAIRIRGFLITVSAVLSIHVYVAALFIVYPLNGWYK